MSRPNLAPLLCALLASTSLLSPASAQPAEKPLAEKPLAEKPLAERPRPAPARPKADRPAPRDVEQRLRDLEERLTSAENTIRRLQLAGGPPLPTRVGEPDPAKAYQIPVDDSPAIGPRVAPVTLVAAVQFPEPYTAKAWPVLQQLRAEYKGQLRMVFKLFVVHPKHEQSSLATCAAGTQGQLERMADAVLAATKADKDGAPLSGYRELPADELRELARGLRLDLKQYDRDLAACTTGLARDKALLTARGQRGVPMFWINGRPLSGAQPIEQFRTLIDQELTKAKADQAQGGKVSDYYDRLMKGAATAL